MTLPDEPDAREKFILDAVDNERYEADWTTVPVQHGDHVVEFRIFSDALKIDGVRVVAGARVAQLVADKLGASLPTPRMLDLAWSAASVKVPPCPRPISRASIAVLSHSEDVDDHVAGRVGLVDNAGKCWVLVNALAIKHGHAANYGWPVPPDEISGGKWHGIPLETSCAGKPIIQGIGTQHGPEQDDYSQTIRLVDDQVLVDGEPRALIDVLRDPLLCGALSHEGPLLVFRQPATPAVPAVKAKPAAPPAPAVPAPTPAATLTPVPSGGDMPDVPFIVAAHYTPANRAAVNRVVIHTAECGETNGAALALAKWGAGPNAPQASWHYAVGADGATQSVREKHIAWHAPGANGDGIGIEHVGRAAQTDADWADEFSVAVLERSAKLVAAICKRWNVPIVRLSPADLIAGKRGLCGHVDVTTAFKKSTHTDPGSDFPWDRYLALILAASNALPAG